MKKAFLIFIILPMLLIGQTKPIGNSRVLSDTLDSYSGTKILIRDTINYPINHGNGKVMTSDANGNITLQTPAGSSTLHNIRTSLDSVSAGGDVVFESSLSLPYYWQAYIYDSVRTLIWWGAGTGTDTNGIDLNVEHNGEVWYYAAGSLVEDSRAGVANLTIGTTTINFEQPLLAPYKIYKYVYDSLNILRYWYIGTVADRADVEGMYNGSGGITFFGLYFDPSIYGLSQDAVQSGKIYYFAVKE